MQVLFISAREAADAKGAYTLYDFRVTDEEKHTMVARRFSAFTLSVESLSHSTPPAKPGKKRERERELERD